MWSMCDHSDAFRECQSANLKCIPCVPDWSKVNLRCIPGACAVLSFWCQWNTFLVRQYLRARHKAQECLKCFPNILSAFLVRLDRISIDGASLSSLHLRCVADHLKFQASLLHLMRTSIASQGHFRSSSQNFWSLQMHPSPATSFH